MENRRDAGNCLRRIVSLDFCDSVWIYVCDDHDWQSRSGDRDGHAVCLSDSGSFKWIDDVYSVRGDDRGADSFVDTTIKKSEVGAGVATIVKTWTRDDSGIGNRRGINDADLLTASGDGQRAGSDLGSAAVAFAAFDVNLVYSGRIFGRNYLPGIHSGRDAANAKSLADHSGAVADFFLAALGKSGDRLDSLSQYLFDRAVPVADYADQRQLISCHRLPYFLEFEYS